MESLAEIVKQIALENCEPEDWLRIIGLSAFQSEEQKKRDRSI